MAYSPTVFVDVPDPQNPPPGAVPLSAAEMNKIGNGIQAAAADADAIEAARGAPNGYASLGADGLVPASQLPANLSGSGSPASTFDAVIEVSALGDTQIVGAVVDKKIAVVSYVFVAAGTVTVRWKSGATNKSGPMPLVNTAGLSRGGSAGTPLLQTGVNEALVLNLSAAVVVGGHLAYILV